MGLAAVSGYPGCQRNGQAIIIVQTQGGNLWSLWVGWELPSWGKVEWRMPDLTQGQTCRERHVLSYIGDTYACRVAWLGVWTSCTGGRGMTSQDGTGREVGDMTWGWWHWPLNVLWYWSNDLSSGHSGIGLLLWSNSRPYCATRKSSSMTIINGHPLFYHSSKPLNPWSLQSTDFLHLHLHLDMLCLGDPITGCLRATVYRNCLLKALRLQKATLDSFPRHWQLEYLLESTSYV